MWATFDFRGYGKQKGEKRFTFSKEGVIIRYIYESIRVKTRVKKEKKTMAEQNNVKPELSLAEIFKILLKKFKILLITLLAGIVVGAGFGLVSTKSVETYGTQINFYVNPVKEKSESQIINGTYGVEVLKGASTLLMQDYFAELLLLDENGVPMPDTTEEVDALRDAARTAWEQGASDAEDLTEDALDAFRTTSQYVSLIQQIRSALSVFYDEEATSFIYVQIKVPNNKALAEFVYRQLCEKVPEYLVESLPLPTGYDKTICTKMSLIDGVRSLGQASPASASIKYALVLGLASLLVGCVVVVVLERTKANKAEKEADKENE